MKGSSMLIKVVPCVASLLLSTGAFAMSGSDVIVDPVTGLVTTTGNVITGTGNIVGEVFFPMQKTHHHEYLVTNTAYGTTSVMTGVKGGVKVSNYGDTWVHPGTFKGDKITNLHTGRTGVITGIKHQGTMDVMSNSGKTVRYQYVTFKVKHL